MESNRLEQDKAGNEGKSDQKRACVRAEDFFYDET